MLNATQIDLTLDDQFVFSVTDTDLFYGQAALIIENTLPLTVVESFDVTESTPQPILTINHKPYRWTFIGGPLPSHLGIGFIPVPLCAMPPIDEPEDASSLPVPAEREVARYYHQDHLGTIRAVTNQAGVIVETHNPLPYGEELNPPSVKDPKMFTGKMRDSESGLDYFGKRYYSSGIGRWLSVDPKLNIEKALNCPQYWNFYMYCGNSPLVFNDPTGEDNYVFYDPKNYSIQAGAEVARLKELSPGNSTHLIPIKTEIDFINSWNNMNTNYNDQVTLLFHSASVSSGNSSKTISIDGKHEEYLTINPNGKATPTSTDTYIGSLTRKKIGILNLYICHTSDGTDNVASTFFKTQDVLLLKGVKGSFNYANKKYFWVFWRKNWEPRPTNDYVIYSKCSFTSQIFGIPIVITYIYKR